MEAAPNVCKLCHEETPFLYSFGWLDAEGKWRDKVTCCERCAPAQAVKQDTALRIASLQSRWAHFGEPRIYPTSQRNA
jgi:hypothetical protein